MTDSSYEYVHRANQIYGNFSESLVMYQHFVYGHISSTPEKQKDYEGNENKSIIKVEHKLIDFQQMQLQNKVMTAIGRTPEKDEDWSDLNMAQFLREVNSKYHMTIDKQQVIRSLMDKQFESTKNFFHWMLILFVMTFLIPLSVYFCLTPENQVKLRWLV